MSRKKNKQNKHQGQLIEAKFTVECLSRDLIIAEPYGDNEKFDFIVGAKPPFFRVQVKSSNNFIKSPMGGKYRILAAHGANSKKPYTKEMIDILAAYVIPYDTWYIMPVEVIRSVSVNLYPHRENHKGYYELHKEDWTVLKGE